MGITISNFQGLWLGFFLRSTPQHLWVIGVYIVWVKKVCIKYDSSTKQNVSRVSCGKALPERHSRKPVVSILSWLFAFQSCAGHMLHFAGSLLTSYLQNMLQSSIVFSLHTLSLSHTTLTNKTHIKYRVHKIEQNCNQIWHRLYNLHTLQFPPFGYSMTKPLKQTLDLKVNLGTKAKLTLT